MKRLLVGCAVVLLGLSGCGEKEEGCTSSRGTLSGMMFTDYQCKYTSSDARLEFTQAGDDTPLLIRPLEDGSYSVDLTAGEWSVEGFGSGDTCTTEEPIPITIKACADLCFDG